MGKATNAWLKYLTVLFNISDYVKYNKKYHNKISYDKKVNFEPKNLIKLHISYMLGVL